MVGRPGRSKGCFKCRKRHLKCDETRPNCLNCLKLKAPCPGYPETAFYDESAAWSKKTVARIPQRPARSTPFILFAAPSTLEPSEVICRSYLHNTIDTWSRIRYPAEQYPMWPGFRALQCSSALPRLCLDSFAFTFFGKTHRLEKVETSGLHLYGQALSRLKTELDRPVREKLVEMVISILILTSFEFLTATSQAGWIEHALGLATMFESVGPSFFSSPDTLLLLECSRQTMILGALAARKDTFLSQQAWKEIPWSANKLHKCDQQYFCDLLADVPAIMRQFGRYSMATDSTARSIQQEDLKQQIMQLLQRLRLWRLQWDVLNQGHMWEDCSEKPQLQSPGEHRPLQFRYAQVANELLNYDATELILLELVEELLVQEIDSHAKSDWPWSIEEIQAQRKDLADEICRTIPWYISKSDSILMHLDLLFPIRLAWRTVRHCDSTLSQWLEALVVSLPFDSGFQIGQHATIEYVHPSKIEL